MSIHGTRMAEPSCPNCGNTETIEDLMARRDELQKHYDWGQWPGWRCIGLPITVQGGFAQAHYNSMFTDTDGNNVPSDKIGIRPSHRTCAACGMVRDEDAVDDAREIKKEIAKLREQVFSGIERLGHLADEDLAEEARESEEILRGE